MKYVWWCECGNPIRITTEGIKYHYKSDLVCGSCGKRQELKG